MHFTTPIILSLLTLTTSLPLQQRSATTLLSDISTISGYVSTLTSDAASYTGGLLQSLGLAITVDSLESSLTTATSDATSSTTFSSTDSDSILAAITTLTPKILTLLGDLDAISSTIATAGFTSTVESALNTLTSDTNALFAAVEAKVDSGDAASLATLQTSIDAAFATALATF